MNNTSPRETAAVPVCENLSWELANEYGLALSASGVAYAIRESGEGWEIWVHGLVRDRAFDIIEQCILDNSEPAHDEPKNDRFSPGMSALAISLLLIGFNGVINRYLDYEKIVAKYGSSASHIMDGEFYRAAASLMIHADTAHLLGNVAGMAIFASSVCAIAGPGIGGLMILLSGILGNLTTAALFQSGHYSIGASTSVFGALGILSSHQFSMKIKTPIQRKRAWLSLAGGLALLGLLGTSPHSDLTGHFFGFAAGIFLGLLHHFCLKNLLNQQKHQIYSAIAAIGIIIFSWGRQ
jgi:membrane associated rhomboid family serine protease